VRSAQRAVPSDRRANRGKTWERECEASLALYMSRRSVSCWFRCHPEVKVTKAFAKGQIQGFIKAKGPPDVVVAITDGPVLLADFKDSSADRFSLSNISTHQAQRFDEWHGPGRAAAVLLRLQGRRFVVPWEPLRIAVQSWHQSRAEHGRAQAGSASLSLEQLQEVGLPFDSSGWLEPLMSWWRSQ
jgi:penicillin-binding protein-related factor A (putative recombinase)